MASVVVADDESAIAALLRDALEQLGYDVRCAENGSVALEMAKAKRPDLVITDAMMPILRGPDLVRRMDAEESLRRVPVILMSATSILDVPFRRCERLEVVMKPFRLPLMLELVRQIVGSSDALALSRGPIKDTFDR